MTKRGKLIGGAVAVVAVVAGIGWAVTGAAPDVPTAVVERGRFVDAVQMRGEVKAGRSITIIAPSDAGDLRIMKLVRNGTVRENGRRADRVRRGHRQPDAR